MLTILFFIVFDAYKKLSGSDIEDSIEGETTGNLENLLLAVGKTYYKKNQLKTKNGTMITAAKDNSQILMKKNV